MNFGKYFFRKIDEVRDDLIGAEIVDIEHTGKVFHLKCKDGRGYTIDASGCYPVVHAGNTADENISTILTLFELLCRKLNIDVDELSEYSD